MEKRENLSCFAGLIMALMLLTPFHPAYPQAVQPVRVKVGDPIVSGEIIEPYKNLWRLTYSKPGREPLDAATWSDEVEMLDIGGRKLCQRTQVATYKKQPIVTTLVNIFDARTMVPISRDFRQNNGTYGHIDFGDHGITFERVKVPGGEIMRGRASLGTPVYDFFGGMYGLLLTAFPFNEGFSATLPSLDETSDEVRWATFKVVRKEMVEAGPGKEVEAWVVETDDHGPMTFWLSKKAPYIIKLVYVAPGGVTATYTMM